MDPSGDFLSCYLPTSSLLTGLACIPLALIGIMTLYSFFPTDTVEDSMLERNRRGEDIGSGVNLLCSNAFSNRQGRSEHCGTFVYDSNDPSGQSIRGLFYLGRPVGASVNGRNYMGYVKKEENMVKNHNGGAYTSTVLSESIDGLHKTPGACYVISLSRLNSIKQNNYVYSGNTHLVPNIPVISTPHGERYRNKLPVHVRSFEFHATLNR